VSAVRREQHNKRRGELIKSGQRKRVTTLGDLEESGRAEQVARAQFPTTTGAAAVAGQEACLAMGKEMLVRTNAFRATLKLPPLVWHQALCDIGMAHSKAMAEGKVPLGHDGAKARFAAYPFTVHSAAENVAFSQGHSQVAATHVDGWVNSAGHLTNIKARHDWCAIAVYHNVATDAYYSTQLFGR
jgi:uncharacterized protein YkwD